MRLKAERGQGLILAIMVLGVIMAGLVMFGYDRSHKVNELIDKLDTSQAAFEALNAAAKRVQNIYSSESGCDPTTFNTRISSLGTLPATAKDMGTHSETGVKEISSYAIAQPSLADAAARVNRCTAGSGCRQIAVPIDSTYYIVTVGAISRDDPLAARETTDCPRDASVRLSVAVNGNVYFQRFTLTNLCTLASCNCVSGSCAEADKGFSNINITSSATGRTLACTGLANKVAVRAYGSFVNSSNTVISSNDLRWARTYLETGGGASGDTTFLYTATPVTSYSQDGFNVSNGACTPTLSASQCRNQPCFPAFDLNRDGANNEADIAIMEHYLRGYLTSLPVNELL